MVEKILLTTKNIKINHKGIKMHWHNFASVFVMYVCCCDLTCLWLYYISVCGRFFIYLLCRFHCCFWRFWTFWAFRAKVRSLWKQLAHGDWSKQQTVRVGENADWFKSDERFLCPEAPSRLSSDTANRTSTQAERQHG